MTKAAKNILKRLETNYSGTKHFMSDEEYFFSSVNDEELNTLRKHYSRISDTNVIPEVVFKNVDLASQGILCRTVSPDGVKLIGNSLAVSLYESKLKQNEWAKHIIETGQPNPARIKPLAYIDHFYEMEDEVGLDVFSKLKAGDSFKMMPDKEVKVVKVTAVTMTLDINGEVVRYNFKEFNNRLKALLRDLEAEVYFEMSQINYFGDVDKRLLDIYNR